MQLTVEGVVQLQAELLQELEQRQRPSSLTTSNAIVSTSYLQGSRVPEEELSAFLSLLRKLSVSLILRFPSVVCVPTCGSTSERVYGLAQQFGFQSSRRLSSTAFHAFAIRPRIPCVLLRTNALIVLHFRRGSIPALGESLWV